MSQSGHAGPTGAGLLNSWYTLSPNLRGMVLMGVFAFVVNFSHTVVRALSAEIDPMQIAFFRTIIPLFFLIPMLVRQGRQTGVTWWKTTRPGLQLARGFFGGFSMIAWFYTLSLIPVGDATALSFTVVIFASLGAVLFLGERIGIRRVLAIAVGVIGTLIIVRPGAQVISLGAVTAIFSSLFWAAAVLCVKVLARTDSNITIVFYSSVFFALIAVGPAIYFWIWPTWEQLALLCLVGFCALIAQLAMTAAVRDAETTAIMPVDFTRLLWAALTGYIWFGEFPDLWTWVGGGVVFAATLYITYRESRKAEATVAGTGPGTGA